MSIYVKKNEVELWCPWCEHVDKYMVAKHDAPRCKKCRRYVPKKRK